MHHRRLYVYDRQDGGRTLHWKAGCALRFGGRRERLHEYDRDHPLLLHLAGQRPEAAILALVEMFDALICVHCVPEPVLDRLGIEKPPGARAGTILPPRSVSAA